MLMFIVYPALVILGAVTFGAGLLSALLREETDRRSSVIGVIGIVMLIAGLTAWTMTAKSALTSMAAATGQPFLGSPLLGGEIGSSGDRMADSIEHELGTAVPAITF